jgi:hypothetical protein
MAGQLGRSRVDAALERLAVGDAERRGDGAPDQLEVLRPEGYQRAGVGDFRS